MEPKEKSSIFMIAYPTRWTRGADAPAFYSTREIGLAVGAVINKCKMKKHLAVDIKDGQFAFSRRTEQIAREAELDGIYILRTSLSDDACSSDASFVHTNNSRVLSVRFA